MRIHKVEQNSLEWLALRAGILTASEASDIVTPKFKIKDGKAVDSLIAQKVAERWVGGNAGSFMSLDMELGKILETEAIPAYTFEYGEEIQRVGFITNDDLTIGCSPDGLIGDEGGIEIKCPNATNHVKYLLAREVPDEYIAQVHFSMFVTGRPWWVFMSYRREFPNLILRVDRDEKIMATIAEAVDLFSHSLDRAMERMIEWNGGEKPPVNKFREELLNPKPEEPENVDNIP